MTDAISVMPEGITGDQLNDVTFSTAKGFARGGYDAQEVDTFLRRSATAVDRLNDRLTATEQQLQAATAEIQQLRDRIDKDSLTNHVQQAVSVLTTAQITADSTVAQADQYSARVMAEARDLYDDARRNSAILEQETEEKARAVFDDALHRVTDLEREGNERLAQITMTTAVAQQELDGQTVYLRTLRDATRVQMVTFLEGLLDHVSAEYGRANPMAADRAKATAKATLNGSVTVPTGTVTSVTNG